MSEFNNRAVYQDGKGCRKVALLPIIQRFLDVMVLLMSYIQITPRGCYEPVLPTHEIGYWASRGIRNEHGYWSIKVGGTQIGLHAMYWIWIHRRHPAEGTQIGHLCSNSGCFLHGIEIFPDVNDEMKFCSINVRLPDYVVTLHCTHTDFKCYPPPSGSHLMINGKYGEKEMALSIDIPRVVQLLRSQFLPAITFITPPPRNLVCYFCFEDYTPEGSWKDFSDHYKGHARSHPGEYSQPRGALWNDLYGHFIYLGSNIGDLHEVYNRHQSDLELVRGRAYSRNYRVRCQAKIDSAIVTPSFTVNPQPAAPMHLAPPPSKWVSNDDEDFVPEITAKTLKII